MKRDDRDDNDNEDGNQKRVVALLLAIIFIIGFAFGQYSAVRPHCSASSLTLSGKVLYNKQPHAAVQL